MSELRVTTAHLRELSAKQQQAAAEIAAATELTHGVGGSVMKSHGVICAATAGAVSTADGARTAAGEGMREVSTDLAEKLDSAAASYDSVDQQQSGDLDQQMHPRGA
ncbi:ESX-1 secretion-associated protein [Mycobacterium sp. SM1]|uniref:ESX-1 secretion-associated protein n=1 Tax=Mycobacterium sp. SM1 TaxID=2816243 RepID=UPI001BCBA093|nr:ESX-1 secretion-associated protein [Mycobacterium sp. SM1]MBS4728050.1 ESX-1 secretion-associated protein [Mycobacterium sp. SM1]